MSITKDKLIECEKYLDENPEGENAVEIMKELLRSTSHVGIYCGRIKILEKLIKEDGYKQYSRCASGLAREEDYQWIDSHIGHKIQNNDVQVGDIISLTPDKTTYYHPASDTYYQVRHPWLVVYTDENLMYLHPIYNYKIDEPNRVYGYALRDWEKSGLDQSAIVNTSDQVAVSVSSADMKYGSITPYDAREFEKISTTAKVHPFVSEITVTNPSEYTCYEDFSDDDTCRLEVSRLEKLCDKVLLEEGESERADAVVSRFMNISAGLSSDNTRTRRVEDILTEMYEYDKKCLEEGRMTKEQFEWDWGEIDE